jgi:hypothetical protein
MEDIKKETVQIGDKVVDIDAITPSDYFEHVKGLKTKLDETEYAIILDNALTMLEKTKKTGQLAMAKKLAHQAELALREIEAARQGFNIFVLRKDIETYIDKIEDKPVKVIELSRYSREIPDDKIDIISKARDIFDELYIVYTDYALKDTKKVAKHRRDKDPIVFGAFIDKTSNKEDTIYVEDRMFFITDWVEEKCDLTLEEIVRYTSDKMGKTITYTVPTTESGVRQINNYLKSFTVDKDKEDIKLKPTEIFKKKVTKAVSKLKKVTRGRKKKTDEE